MMSKKGIYMMAIFEKGKKHKYFFDRKKPFKIDKKTGEAYPIVMRVFGGNIEFDEWHFFENKKIVDFNNDNQLREECNNIHKNWCEKHKRKYKPILRTGPELIIS